MINFVFYYFNGRKSLRKKVLRFLRFWLKSQKFIPAKYSKICEPQKFFPQKFHDFSNRKSFFRKIFMIFPTAKVFSVKFYIIFRREIPPTESLYFRSSLTPISMKYFREDLLCRTKRNSFNYNFIFFDIKIYKIYVK